jgi:hypothetical protein
MSWFVEIGSLCSPGWPWNLDLPASAFLMLGLQVWATMPGSSFPEICLASGTHSPDDPSTSIDALVSLFLFISTLPHRHAPRLCLFSQYTHSWWTHLMLWHYFQNRIPWILDPNILLLFTMSSWVPDVIFKSNMSNANYILSLKSYP